ncbi:hypothetical protein T439DRAFT_321664 [Meredithblackwellia eburnea MCA 4105]
MATVAQLVGIQRDENNQLIPSLAGINKVDPDEFPALAEPVAALNTDIRTLYSQAWSNQEQEDRENDRHFLDRAKEYVELNEQVETSNALLTDLSTFLSTFQRDLSAVSGHISELQGRSKTIEARLAARKAVERSLSPLLSAIIIPPALIQTIFETEVSEAWVPPITELDAKLGAIRSGPRIESRKALDDAAEGLRLHASLKILTYFISLLRPFSLSISGSLYQLQTSHLLPLKPLFDFLRRHAARQAHEFQKAYVSTVRWYYETGFRRYVRALEKLRLKAVEKVELIGEVNLGSKASLALLSKKNNVVTGPGAGEAHAQVMQSVQIEGPPVILAHQAADSAYRPPPEALFRSISLVLMDNAETEYSFIAAFFGQHSSLAPMADRPESPNPGLFSPPSGGTSFADEMDGAESVLGSEAGKASIAGSTWSKDDRGDKLRKAVVEGLWKSVMEPAQEYSRNFASALVDSTSLPSATSLLAMIRLNESIIALFVDQHHCPPMESHLIGLRMTLWPTFSKLMNSQIDSVRKINGSGGSSSGGVLAKAVGATSVKDSAVQIITLRYAELFNAFVALSGEQDEEMVFGSILRLRQELDRLLLNQASRISDPLKQKAFLATHYEELLQGLSAGLSTHPRSQTELAHYRELARKSK